MYIETSGSRRPGDKARLIGPMQHATQGKCVHFFYHMLGSGIGSLNVYLKSQNIMTQLWTRSGQTGSLWHQASITVQASYQYQVRMIDTCHHFTSVSQLASECLLPVSHAQHLNGKLHCAEIIICTHSYSEVWISFSRHSPKWRVKYFHSPCQKITGQNCRKGQ
jgi:hypothetical protein